MMRCFVGIVLVIALWSPARADTQLIVVMTSGDRFPSSQVWEEGDKIRFNMQGLVVSVNKEEVAAIIPATQGGASPPPLPATPPTAHSAAPDGGVLADNLPTTVRPGPDRRHSPNDRARGERENAQQLRSGTQQPQVVDEIGIDGVAWRISPEQMDGLQRLDTDPAFGGIDQYWRPDHPLSFDNALLDGLVYGFWNLQLYTIVMWAEGRIGYERLRKALITRFGPGRRTGDAARHDVWVGETTQRMLEFDTTRNMAIFVMRSTALHEQIRRLYPE
ncbi:hypothetical protein [Desulfatitalea alkaliphila]|uniref:Uncharacterized protein n=1 Tax=Desulfatitalea alkaliphila TaxID=2929485 RepID=A0AA41R7I2_9BACT|nr:hypothetical protein [Desulfatitalea alkaliphila]MCJ8502406.1 hypothetical protein [Desulfatitalea alkaliphila]